MENILKIEMVKFQKDIGNMGIESNIVLKKTSIVDPYDATKIIKGVEIADITTSGKETLKTFIFIPNKCLDALKEALKLID